MEVGLISETGLSVRLNVVEESWPEPDSVTTQLLRTVVQSVKEGALKYKHVTLSCAQVTFLTNTFNLCMWGKYNSSILLR